MIRLLKAENCRLPSDEERKAQQTAPYVIISHVWNRDEMVFEDMAEFDSSKPSTLWKKPASAAKMSGACKKVLEVSNKRIKHLWLDTVCINKKDPFELSTSINSMYRWYKRAAVCFAYLYDYPSNDVVQFTESEWFTRGWTLQELVAPKKVLFFDKDWRLIGDKASLQVPLTNRTKINSNFLLHTDNISHASVSQRMSWFSGRKTTVPEDTAYCLLGLFGVNMPLLYGEGEERAFKRLQEEIMRYSDDHSLFAWKHDVPQAGGAGLLAESPAWFRDTGAYVHKAEGPSDMPFQMTNKGISITLCMQRFGDSWVASIDCPQGERHYLGIFLECLSSKAQQYRRIKTNELCKVVRDGRGEPKSIFVKPPDDI